MTVLTESQLPSILAQCESQLLKEWSEEQTRATGLSKSKAGELRAVSAEFLRALCEATAHGNLTDIRSPEWKPVLNILNSISRTRAAEGSGPSETATFVFSLKQYLFARIRDRFATDPDGLAVETWAANSLLDSLGLYTTEMFQKAREEVISRQQQELLELSTPVVKLWDGILAVPLIGTLDSNRTQIVMESLLQEIMDTGSEIAIIDITGVPTVDTLVAQHLMKTIAATRLMGAECIVSGIRPQIAQTIVHLGVELGDVVTKATLADAFMLALRKLGATISIKPSSS